MGLLNVIRKLRLRQGLAIREIERRTGVSRNTIKKYLKADVIEPKFATPERSSKLDPFAETLAGWLKTNAKKGRKDRHTLKKMHADLVALGFTGSYNRVAAFARQWRADRQRDEQTTGRGTFVPLAFRPGEAFQFDWSEDFAVIGGERMKLQMAHIKLSHSRAFLLRAYPLQTHEMLFDAHWHAFRVFGGVPERGIYDNMKTAVDLVGRGKARQVNIRFLAMANHYVFEPDFCNPAAGWEKGQVEKNVRDSRHQMLQGMPDFPDLAALNDWLEQRCVALWHETAHGTLPGTIADVWAEERAALMPLPVAFDGFIEISKRVSPTCLISFERNRYSVPASFANRPVSLRVYPDRLVVAAEGHILCEHIRIIQRSHKQPAKTVYDWRHYLAVVQRKPGALRNGAGTRAEFPGCCFRVSRLPAEDIGKADDIPRLSQSTAILPEGIRQAPPGMDNQDGSFRIRVRLQDFHDSGYSLPTLETAHGWLALSWDRRRPGGSFQPEQINHAHPRETILAALHARLSALPAIAQVDDGQTQRQVSPIDLGTRQQKLNRASVRDAGGSSDIPWKASMFSGCIRLTAVLAAALSLATCGEVDPPMRALVPIGGSAEPAMAPAGDVYIGLAFSGGGHRATAFGYGVLDELRAVGADQSTGGLAERVRFVSGVSGGAVIATWFALHGAEGLAGFRERYLLSNAERYMTPDGLDPEVLARALVRGMNGHDTFGRALEETLFEGARFSALEEADGITLRIVASDVASAAPFVFDATTFGALCSDLSRLPLSEAVAASAAFPIVFRPFVIEAHRRNCGFVLSPTLAAATDNRQAHPAMRLLARTIARYADPAEIQSVRLLDGGMTDSYGTTGFLAARAEGGLSPMSPGEAVRVRRILLLAVDAAHDNWRLTDILLPTGRLLALSLYGLNQRLSGDGGGELELLLAGRAITATTTGSYAALSASAVLWRREIVAWRCALDEAELDALYPDRPADWDCHDLHVHVGQVGFDNLPAAMEDRMDDIPTRLTLSAADIDAAIRAGRTALRRTTAYAAFLRALGG